MSSILDFEIVGLNIDIRSDADGKSLVKYCTITNVTENSITITTPSKHTFQARGFHVDDAGIFVFSSDVTRAC